MSRMYSIQLLQIHVVFFTNHSSNLSLENLQFFMLIQTSELWDEHYELALI